MADIRVNDSTVHNLNANSQIAADPFSASTKFCLNEENEKPIIAQWTIEGYPQAGTVVLCGNCTIEEAAVGDEFKLLMTIERRDFRAERLFELRIGSLNRYGILFDHDGSVYNVTFSVWGNKRLGGSLVIHPIETHSITSDVASVHEPLLINGGPALISCNQGGLMNRLIPLMSLKRIGRKTGRSVGCIWSANDHCAAAYRDLFEAKAADGSEFSAENFTQFVSYGNEDAVLDLNETKDTLVHAITPVRTINPVMDSTLKEVGQEFKDIRLSAAVTKKISTFDGVEFDNVIGFHIRRPYPNGAFAEQENAKFTLGIDTFIDLIEQLRRGLPQFKKLLICTNDGFFEKQIERVFGDYVFSYQKKSIDNTTDPEAVQEALVDLTLLSRCGLLFSQETTAFGTFAHLVGNNKLLALTRETDTENFHFYLWVNGVHAKTVLVSRVDASGVFNEILSD